MGKDTRGKGAGSGGSGTPARELDRLRRRGDAEEMARRCRMQRAALEAAGEVGYHDLAVRHVLVRSGEARARFYSHFENKADCFATAYGLAIERLVDRLLDAAAAEQSWRAGLRRALTELADFLREQPLLARAILVEVKLAGKPTRIKRKEAFDRLFDAIDSARRVTERRHVPPTIAAEFIVCAVEETVVSALARRAPADFESKIDELAYLAVAVYFGKEAAREELGRGSA